MGSIIVTGAAGFIGWKTAQKLLDEGRDIIGIDNINNYYDALLKSFRLKELKKSNNFRFYQKDIENIQEMGKIFHDNTVDIPSVLPNLFHAFLLFYFRFYHIHK